MKYLIDTNVISELVKTNPDLNVVNWFKLINSDQIYLSVLTIGEIRKGISKLNDQVKQVKITHWLENDLMQWFDGRILVIDQKVSNMWGIIQAESVRMNSVIDNLIAATALCHNMTIATRNIKDFMYPNLSLINPWNMN